ncbi:MAG: acyl-CoA carboxylase subunit beta [Sphaerochaetaceae bacterium]|nr:acyl-CoA carboxylase subunit beta [Sphaerochaetaceae bacterium]
MEQNYNLKKQHKLGKYHAVERILKLVDKDSFFEIGSKITHNSSDFGMKNRIIPYDGVITGFGNINGKKVGIYSQDFTLLGGSLGKMHGEKISNLIKNCIKIKCPIIGINDSGGARIQEGIHSLAGYGKIFFYNTKASGFIPQISIIAGPCAGGAVYSPGLTDFVFVIDKISNMFVTGPRVVKSVTFQDVTADELGGAKVHSSESGVAHFISKNESTCFEKVKKLLNTIPFYYGDKSPTTNSNFIEKNQEAISAILPKEKNKPYNVKKIINEILDDDSFIEIQSDYAKNVVIGLGEISEKTVGIVANQPLFLAGVLDCNASDKISRFVRYCDSFDIPLITLTDVPGFLPGRDQETKGIIRHGAKVLYAYSEATVPKINVILRKAYGGAYIAMCSKHLGADFVYAWPTAEIAVMGAESAVEVLYSKELKNVDNKKIIKQEKINSYNEKYLNPDIASRFGYIDEVIVPINTRKVLYKSLLLLETKDEFETINKKHGNIPL